MWLLSMHLNYYILIGVYFELNDIKYLNNSAVPLADIGEGESALLCKTDKKDCCAFN